VKETLFLF